MHDARDAEDKRLLEAKDNTRLLAPPARPRDPPTSLLAREGAKLEQLPFRLY